MNCIYTVTLNPALDIHYTLEDFCLGTENYPSERRKLAAGKGVNVSRVLKRHGVDAPAYMLLGSDNRAEYIRLLEQYEVPHQYVEVPGQVRENISLNCPKRKMETRICMKDFTASIEDVKDLVTMLMEEAPEGAYIALCGSLPRGVTAWDFVTLCTALNQLGYRLVVDCPTLTLQGLKKIDPWLIKPNKEEAMALLGIKEDLSGPELAHRLATSFERVLLSLGEEGVVYASGDQVITMPSIPTKVYTTVGAGDSLVAGFLYGTVCHPGDIAKALACGLQFAAETCTGMI